MDELLRDGAAALGLALSPATLAQLARYLDLLNQWNAVHNLTAVRDRHQQVIQHLLDCLAVLPHLPPGALADVGSGAGLPGLIIAICQPRPVLLIESNGKKCAFLNTAVAQLGLEQVRVFRGRVEDCRETAAVIISRALAEVNLFLQLTEHLGTATSRWLLMKGPKAEKLARADFSARTIPLTVPHLAAERQLLLLARA